jgi:hypothetical protein
MHRRLVVFLLLTVPIAVWAVDVSQLIAGGPYNYNPPIQLSFTENSLIVHYFGRNQTDAPVTIPVKYEQIRLSTYIPTLQDADFRKVNFSLRKGRYLALFTSGFLCLYDGDMRFPALYCSPKSMWGIGPNQLFTISSSSNLVEKNVSYDTEYMKAQWLGKPWAARKPSHGIGESMTFSSTTPSNLGEHTICVAIVNGFVSYKYPDLYEKNNRVKTLEVIGGDGHSAGVFKLEDRVGISYLYFTNHGSDFKFVVRQVYKGSMYDDICVTDVEPIPID